MTPELKGFLLLSIIKMLAVFTLIMVGVALLTLMERKVSAWMQNRFGPNRVGPGGLLQPAADGLKNILKEETFPSAANPVLFLLAPALAFIPALLLSAVIPIAAPLRIESNDFGNSIGAFIAHLPLIGPPIGRFVSWLFHAVFGVVAYHGLMPLAVADVPVGFLFVLAVSSMGVFGVALAGWSSNSKYALLGGLRASAQMVSYEVSMGLALIPILLLAGNVSFSEIITTQQQSLWFVGPLFLSFFIYLISGFAETNRLPFDLPEAESELVAGYHSEYSAMKFSMFFIAEYANVVTIAMMVTTLFFGGWDVPFTNRDQSGALGWVLLSHVSFFVKTFFWIFFIMWIRWTLPRFRYDQLMALGWKVLMPLALAYIMIICLADFAATQLFGITNPRGVAVVLTGVSVVVAFIVFVLLDRGVLIQGAGRRRRAALAAPRGPASAAAALRRPQRVTASL
jgi:NADH-quinone oxidoreductase subunit H